MEYQFISVSEKSRGIAVGARELAYILNSYSKIKPLFLPFFKQKNEKYIFLVCLSSFIQTGYSILDSMKKLENLFDGDMRKHIGIMIQRLKEDNFRGWGYVFDTGLYSKNIVNNLEDYGNLGTFQEAISRIGYKSIQDAIEKEQDKINTIKTILISFVISSITVMTFLAVLK